MRKGKSEIQAEASTSNLTSNLRKVKMDRGFSPSDTSKFLASEHQQLERISSKVNKVMV